MRLYVRCCCQPGKILGTINVPVGSDDIPLPQFKVEEKISPHLTSGKTMRIPTLRSYVAEVRELHENGHFREWAVYSDDRGIEFWREIDGFVEVPNHG